jgi:hypothetical protein
MQAVKGLSMEKWLCWGSLGVAGLMLLLFILDLTIGIPFGGLSKPIDILGILASAVVVYLALNALRDVL